MIVRWPLATHSCAVILAGPGKYKYFSRRHSRVYFIFDGEHLKLLLPLYVALCLLTDVVVALRDKDDYQDVDYCVFHFPFSPVLITLLRDLPFRDPYCVGVKVNGNNKDTSI
jgi:hypothetical protein